MMVGVEPVMSGTGAKSLEQHHLQVAAMDGELRMSVTRGPAEGLAINQLAEAIEEGRVLGGDRDPRQVRFKSERGQFPGGMRKQVDANSDRPDFGRRFKYPAGDSSGVQRQPKGQSADAGPDDKDVVHVCSRPCLLPAMSAPGALCQAI